MRRAVATVLAVVVVGTSGGWIDGPGPPAAFQSYVRTVTAADLGASWRPGCPLPPSQLRAVDLSHFDFDNRVVTGTLIVHVDHVATVIAIFHDLYDDRFAIQRMDPVDVFGGDDNASMAANNTSAFNSRRVTGGKAWSQHSFGWAIDINPVQNPYVRSGIVLPPDGVFYLDRTRPAQGKILGGDPTVVAFTSRGWGWGGYWTNSKDYQHFSLTGT